MDAGGYCHASNGITCSIRVGHLLVAGARRAAEALDPIGRARSAREVPRELERTGPRGGGLTRGGVSGRRVIVDPPLCPLVANATIWLMKPA